MTITAISNTAIPTGTPIYDRFTKHRQSAVQKSDLAPDATSGSSSGPARTQKNAGSTQRQRLMGSQNTDEINFDEIAGEIARQLETRGDDDQDTIAIKAHARTTMDEIFSNFENIAIPSIESRMNAALDDSCDALLRTVTEPASIPKTRPLRRVIDQMKAPSIQQIMDQMPMMPAQKSTRHSIALLEPVAKKAGISASNTPPKASASAAPVINEDDRRNSAASPSKPGFESTAPEKVTAATVTIDEVPRKAPAIESTRLPSPSKPQLTAAQKHISEGLMQRYGLPYDLEKGASAELKEAFDEAAIAFSNVGCTNSYDAVEMLQKILYRDNLVRAFIGGSLMVGTGYSAGMWSVMRGVTPHIKGMPAPLQGFVAGWIVSTIDKLVSSGFAAVANNLLYSGGPGKDIPVLNSTKPTLKKIAATSAAIAGTGTFLKNLSLRGLSVQTVTPDRATVSLVDLAADTGGSFISGGVGRHLSHRKLFGKHEEAYFLAQRDIAAKLEIYNTPTTSAAIGRGIAKNAAIFAKALGKSMTMPSNWMAGAYCSLLMTALLSAHAHIIEKSGNKGNHEDRLEAFQHTLASSGLMGLLVGGAVFIGIMGFLDKYRNQAIHQLSKRFSATQSEPENAGTAHIHEIEEVG
jgi:hypothetical protein